MPKCLQATVANPDLPPRLTTAAGKSAISSVKSERTAPRRTSSIRATKASFRGFPDFVSLSRYVSTFLAKKSAERSGTNTVAETIS